MAQLVNLQNGELLEIPAGESLIGRGPLLKVTDKRVSRNHAALKLENGVLHICPKHKNPTFFKAAADKGSYSMLAKEQWQKLEDKDCFSLLPNDLVFRVVGGKVAAEGASKDTAGCQTSQSCSDSKDILDEIFGGTESKDESTTSTVRKGTEKTENKVEENATGLKHDPTLPTLELADETPPSSSVLNGDSSISTDKPTAPPPPQTSTSSVSSQPAMRPSLSTSNKRRNLPSWLQSISSDDLSPLPPAKKQRTAASPTSIPPPPAAKAAPGHKPAASKPSGSKTTRVPVSKTVTKTKAASKITDSAAKAASSVDAPPQLDKGSSPTRDDKEAVRTAGAGEGGAGREEVKMVVPESPKTGTHRPPKKAEDAGKEDKDLPLCPYGTKCYRKNPAHFKEYSHDSTRAVTADGHSGSEGEEEEEAAKPVCPYGASCYRKNPAHFVEFSHSSSPVQGADSSRRRRRKKTKGTKPSALAGDSDDEGEPNTYDYNDSFIDDDNDGSGSSTSYAGDSSDSDWAPEGGGGGGGRMEDNGEEEVAELLADAQAFIGNKKMRR